MIKKTIILILLSTLFISCNEGTRYDEPDAPITTNNTSIGNTPDNRPSLETVKVDSVETIMPYKKTYKASINNKGCWILYVSIADILSTPGFVRVWDIEIYQSKYHSSYRDDYGTNPPEHTSGYTIQEDSTLRVDLVCLYTGQYDFDVIVSYEVKVKVPTKSKSHVIGAD